MSTTNPGRIRDVIVGLCAVGLAVVLLTVAYLAYHRVLVPSETVTLRTDVVGNAMQTGSDVKLNGVPIGRVEKIRATEEGAALSLALNPDVLELLPDNVVARLLPKTLFGERYVALVEPGTPSGSRLRGGDVIRQDASAEAAELQQVLDELLPVMKAIQPDKLAAMMGEFAEMLRGNGEEIGDALSIWQRYLTKLEPLVPQMADDLVRLGRVAEEWNVAAPDLVDALATMTTSTQLLVDEQTQLRDVYASVIGSADTTRGWVASNHNTITVLSKESRRALRATSPYASQFPCLLRAVRDFIPKMEQTLGKGRGEPGLHAVLQVVPTRSKYLAGRDKLTYTKGNPKPRCPYVTGQVGTQPAPRATLPGTTDPAEGADTGWPATGTPDTDDSADTGDSGEPPAIAPPPGSSVQSYEYAMTGLGDANSPGENQLIAELVAPTQGMAPGEYPTWSSLLLGPTLRNTKVVLR
ncbi:MCE family protein [Nocardioides carbamazepini]|uniref:MCE family protein n=1 Tax=Nocardioides carbamazepini TaxID=2854259 RepID=UPI002149B653|nr:MCE family protein [Nocardioides carbamazepini]MCR1786504.1 MCE family protein [Nocardioides carbamazepini]